MPWNENAPDVTKSVKLNGDILQENTTYIKTTMNVDHHWKDPGSDLDGHHQFAQMPIQGTAAVPADATLATAMDGAYYTRAVSDADSPDNQDAQPFFINNEAVGVAGATQIMQLLGIRAMAVFSAFGGTVVTKYVFNVEPATALVPGTGVVRTNTGRFTVNFTNALPTANYMVLGGGIANNTSSNLIYFGVNGSNINPPVTKTSSGFSFRTTTFSGSPSLIDPNEVWFVCFGG